MQSYRIETVL